ncbi:MAG: Ser/Thr and Tyr protein phosphatase (dual specificity) [Parcubacteria group bacterium Gr01-1014_18]|nr:MAG: Ser/Thr and Tyr protein phosphatase (dual specificity) [Parcubacteria group bacterium Greene0416_36]TSC81281.1 MAG: Ser/Thr and Tyr protein phosphatase (dual specificity) [Parcubacteria group bacterium Gr01-1014_18]TSC99303.1 MAG: Ser/Thr and Tyr protein phosphatase (dual specificity) [Parcubacteria group bacterium Greene1014_20]TSD06860.1 MAG: Ser/Thr and Tyr protein phosphatase (dual specificity) [Parcubacteria group bacterium Greene0714_2]
MSKPRFFRKKIFFVLLLGVITSVAYFPTNHFRFFDLVEVPILSWDHKIPYIPWMMIVYLSFFLKLALVILWTDHPEQMYRAFYGYCLIIFVSFFIYLFWPTKFYWDHSHCHDFFTQYLYLPMKKLDSPQNACPSSHVSLSFAGAFIFLFMGCWKKGMVFFLWASLIAISTVAVKQHCVMDVVFGFFLSFTCCFFVFIS